MAAPWHEKYAPCVVPVAVLNRTLSVNRRFWFGVEVWLVVNSSTKRM